MSASLVFHLLDIHSRDQRIEEETEEFKKVAFETGLDDSDDDEIRNTRKRKAGSKSNKGRREFIIHLFGETADGKPVQVDVVGFRPAFYILLPSERVSEAIDAVKSYLAGNKIPIDDVVMKRETHESFMGFSARTKYNFLYLDFPSLAMWREARSLFLSDKLVPAVRRPLGPPFQKAPEVFEANIDPMLRFLHVQNLAPCGWIEIEDGIDSSDDIDGTITLTCDFECVEPCAKPPRPTAPFLIASWDIECYSETGDFPIAKKGDRKHGDPVIQIGVSLTRDCRSFERHLFVWPSCDPCDGITVHTSTDEKGMIADFCRWFTQQNPDIILGYNIFGFDEKYLWERAEELRCVASFQGLNRTGAEVKLDEKMLSSSAMGDNYLYTWSTQGRLQIDLYHYIKRGTQLPSYKLDEVTKNYMSGKLKSYRVGEGADSSKLFLDVAGAVKDIRPGRAICLLDAIGESITDKLVVLEVAGATLTVACPSDPDTVKCLEDAQKWVVVKDDVSPQDIFRLHRGSAADRAAVGRYCIQDCDLVLELYKKLEVFNNAMSMANVCSVPINYIFMRGQGVKAESLIFKACRQRGVLIPVLPAPRQHGDSGPPEDSYEGAIVLDPEPGFYHRSPIGVADFASLYPSTIESENISHDSLVWVKDYKYDGTFITCSFGSDKYAECEGYGYTDIEFDIWRPDPDDKRKHPVKVKMGRRICRYAQPLDGSKSTLPEIIRSLLAARKAKRKEAAVEKDAERAALLDAEQLAYKLTANSLYGQLGSGTFKVRLQNLAASVTAYGRKQIMFAKAVIERFYGGSSATTNIRKDCYANVVYGDTDSLFVEFNPRNETTGERLTGREARQAVIDLTAEAGQLVTKALKPPHDFEFDKVFDPMLIFSKKRYAGLMFENNADEFVHKYMGIALKRRDNAPIVKTIFGGAMKKLLIDRDVPAATMLVKQLCTELVEGKSSINQLTITKSLRAEYADPSRIAHKALADRIAVRDPGNAPASGDRIGFVYIRPKAGQEAAKLQGERIETPAYVREHGLLPDYRFYIEHQIQNPVAQMFGIVLEDMPGFDCRILADCPVDRDKRIGWREIKAGELLFNRALNKCTTSDTKQFVKTFFGGATTKSASANVILNSSDRATSGSGSATKKPVQSSISSYLADRALCEMIPKKPKRSKPNE